jgi:hypothetical protein
VWGLFIGCIALILFLGCLLGFSSWAFFWVFVWATYVYFKALCAFLVYLEALCAFFDI